MTQLYSSIDKLLTSITTSTTIITPNRRLSATLIETYNQQQMADKRSVWTPPDILPHLSWMQRLWQQTTSASMRPIPLLLNQAQELLFWRRLIKQEQQQNPMLNVNETALMAKTAADLLIEWEVDLTDPAFNTHIDYQLMQNWFHQFIRLTQESSTISFTLLKKQIIDELAQYNDQLPRQLILYGFTELSPQLQRLMQTCQQLGIQVDRVSVSDVTTDIAQIALQDQADELYTMARWAKQTLQTEDTAKIGCVIPNLSICRDRVASIFSEVFDADTSQYNISAGKKLGVYPIIGHALNMLDIVNQKSLSSDALMFLLRSPFIGGADIELSTRAKLAANLISENINEISIDDLLSSNTLLRAPKRFMRHLQAAHQLLANIKHQHFSHFAKLFHDILAAFGWPGDKTLNSEEYQLIQQWLNLLEQLSTLDYVSNEVTYYEALTMLKLIVEQTMFQPQSPAAPIQVLGMLEAASMPFDQLWVSGLDDSVWPPSPKPNPYIPKSIQRQRLMPHASAEKELAYCHTMMQEFTHCAQKIYFSHARQRDNLELSPSPLISHLPSLLQDELALLPFNKETNRILNSSLSETMEDNEAPHITGNEPLKGGIDIIKQQSLCPFKAFASYRLRTKKADELCTGLRANDKGKLFHALLQGVWQKLQTHDQLMSLSHDKRQILLNETFDQAVTALALSHNSKAVYIQIEKQRLLNYANQLLDLELLRPAFSIAELETEKTLVLNNASYQLRVDRIDQLAENQYLIIDYKLGKYHSPSQWFGERPDDPQLPTYAMIDNTTTAGIAYIQINKTKMCFNGLSNHELDIKGIKRLQDYHYEQISWQQGLSQWQNTLTSLSDAYMQGHAQVDPKSEVTTCKHCGLKSLCRINEYSQTQVLNHD